MSRLRDPLGALRFVRDTSGQDLVEYALLVALVGVVAAASIPTLETALSTAYSLWNTGTQDLWQPPNPGAGS
jgi:Flp pilus assembly pilin Flp